MRHLTPPLLLSLSLLLPASALEASPAVTGKEDSPSLSCYSSLSACSPSHSLSATFSRSSVTEETTILPESTHSSDPETVSREESNSITKTEESESTTSLAVDDPSTTFPSPQKPEVEPDPRPKDPDLSSSTCEPCSDIQPTREYTLNNGIYCGDCDRDGTRDHTDPQNGCVETRDDGGSIPKDGRPVVCIGIPGASPGSRSCFTNCNAFVSFSRSQDPCHENTYNSGTFCKSCLEEGDPTVVFGNEKGNIDDIKSMDFAGILLSLEGWCTAYPRCKDLQTRRRKATDPACAIRIENPPSSSFSLPPRVSITSLGNTFETHQPTPTRQQQRISENSNNHSSASHEQGSFSSGGISQHENSEENTVFSIHSGQPTSQGSADALASDFSTTYVSSIRFINTDGQTFTPRTAVTGRPPSHITPSSGVSPVLFSTDPSSSYSFNEVTLPADRAFADATPSGLATSAARQYFPNMSKTLLGLVFSGMIIHELV